MSEYTTLISDILTRYTALVEEDAEHDPAYHVKGATCGGCERIQLARRLFNLEDARDDVKPIKRPGYTQAMGRREATFDEVNEWNERKKGSAAPSRN